MENAGILLVSARKDGMEKIAILLNLFMGNCMEAKLSAVKDGEDLFVI